MLQRQFYVALSQAFSFFIDQFNNIGVDSIPIITLVGILPAWFCLTIDLCLRMKAVGTTVGLSLHEKLPLFLALWLRQSWFFNGSRLGTMKVSGKLTP
jgi:hypothetical protein